MAIGYSVMEPEPQRCRPGPDPGPLREPRFRPNHVALRVVPAQGRDGGVVGWSRLGTAGGRVAVGDVMIGVRCSMVGAALP